MPVRMVKHGKKITEECIEAFEAKVGSRLPDDYRKFLLKYNGGRPETNALDIPGADNALGVDTFLGIEEMQSKKELLGNRLAGNVWPIADAECGNLVCIHLRGDPGGIYFWDHELEADEDDLPSWQNMLLVAPSFEEFWRALRKFDPSEVELKPGQVEEVWIDPDFLKELKENQSQRSPDRSGNSCRRKAWKRRTNAGGS